MGYSTGWRSPWCILKQCICIWQFFIILLGSPGHTVCCPCVLYCLWAILTCRHTGAAFCGSYLWKPKTLTVAQPYFVFSHDPWILLSLWDIYAPISIWRAVSVSLLSPATYTHTDTDTPFPSRVWGVDRYERCVCLFLPCPVLSEGCSCQGAGRGRGMSWT